MIHNDFDDEGVKCILNGLKENTTLTQLDLEVMCTWVLFLRNIFHVITVNEIDDENVELIKNIIELNGYIKGKHLNLI